jgi:IMP and pyridine-specific 5'-nucleotidase
MKAMLMHSFVLDALETTGADTFSHFEMLIDEHIEKGDRSRLKQLVPTVGVFHTHLPLRKAFQEYNRKHKLTRRKHITISFNEIRHILNLAQVMALAGVKSKQDVTDRTPSDTNNTKEVSKELEDNDMHFVGPKLITFDGDQTLYSDGANFESNRPLAHFLYLLLKHGATIAVVTAAGYEYNTERYEYRLSGLLAYFEEMKLPPRDCERFYLFGGECNYLLQVRWFVKLCSRHELSSQIIFANDNSVSRWEMTTSCAELKKKDLVVG